MIGHSGRDQGAIRRLVNLGLLIGGFGLGQGSIFIAQTYLVATGQQDLLAQFGVHFSFAMLGIIAVESGSLTILSAQIARLVAGSGDKTELWRSYWETTVFRLSIAIVLILGSLIALLSLGLDAFSRGFVAGILPAFFIWAFNGAGFLDGLQKSGISGISGAIAYIAAAIGLVTSLFLPQSQAGLVIGGAMTLGYLLTVIVQFLSLSIAGFPIQVATPRAVGIRKAFIEESSMLAGLLPGQLYFRAQLSISHFFLGSTATAILVYAKQITGAASQIAGFSRRIEFPRMVHLVLSEPTASVDRLVFMQKISLALATAMTLTIFVAGLVMLSLFDGFTEQTWAFLAIFCVTILTESLGQSLIQGMFARQLIHSAAMARVSAVIVATLVCYLLVDVLGVKVFILSDVLSHTIVIGLSYFWLNRSYRAL